MKDRCSLPFPHTDNYHVYDYKIPVKVIDIAFQKLRFPPVQYFTGKTDVFHSPSPVLPPLRKCARVATVHDIYFLRSPDETQKESRTVFARQIERHLNEADMIISVSKFTADEVLDQFSIDEKKIKVIHHGCDHVIDDLRIEQENKGNSAEAAKALSMEKEKVLRELGLSADADIILCVGTVEPRKNPEFMIDVFERIKKRLKQKLILVFAGHYGWNTERFKARLANSRCRKDIAVTGYLARERLNNLYRFSKILVMPSRYEGFGLPVIEAMRLGLPVLSSDSSSLPEVGGGAAEYFQNNNVDEAAEKLISVLENESARNKMMRAGLKRADDFTWSKAAERTMAVYRQVKR
jgi:glycosyltransferase involved in cell wall biosynthesis